MADRCVPVPTCGGGKPPAPSGHTGSMVSFLGVLQRQSGDGLRGLHSGPASFSMRAGLTRGISHSVVMLLHGKSLPVGRDRARRSGGTLRRSPLHVKATHSRGSSSMQRVPKPGLFNSTSAKYRI